MVTDHRRVRRHDDLMLCGVPVITEDVSRPSVPLPGLCAVCLYILLLHMLQIPRPLLFLIESVDYLLNNKKQSLHMYPLVVTMSILFIPLWRSRFSCPSTSFSISWSWWWTLPAFVCLKRPFNLHFWKAFSLGVGFLVMFCFQHLEDAAPWLLTHFIPMRNLSSSLSLLLCTQHVLFFPSLWRFSYIPLSLD